MTIYKNKCKISLHSLHGCCNLLIFKISQCNVGQNALSLMSLDVTKSAMSDMEKQASLHGDVLIFSELRYPCNECNVFLKVNESIQRFSGKDSYSANKSSITTSDCTKPLYIFCFTPYVVMKVRCNASLVPVSWRKTSNLFLNRVS